MSSIEWYRSIESSCAQVRVGKSFPVAALAIAGCLGIVTLALLYFGFWMALGLVVLSLLSLTRPRWAVAVFFLVSSVDFVRPVSGDIQIGFSELQLAVCCLGWIGFLCLAREGEPLGQTGIDLRPALWAAPFLLIVLASCLANLEFYKVVPHLVRRSEPFLALLLSLTVFRGKALAWLRWMIPVAAIGYGSVALLQFVLRSGFARIRGNFGNPNQFAGYLCLLIPFLVVFFLLSRRKRILLRLYPLLLAYVSLLPTLSKSGMFSGLVAGGVAGTIVYRRPAIASSRLAVRELLESWNRRMTGWAFAHGAVLLLLVLALLMSPYGDRALGRVSTYLDLGLQLNNLSVSSVVRSELRAMAVQIWLDHPLLGVGPNGYPRVVYDYSDQLEAATRDRITAILSQRIPDLEERRVRIENAVSATKRNISTHLHNLLLQVGVDFGILGLLGFLYFNARILLRLYSFSKLSPQAIAGLGLLAGVFVHNLFDVTFPSLGLEMGILMGLAIAPLEPDGTSGRPSPELGSRE